MGPEKIISFDIVHAETKPRVFRVCNSSCLVTFVVKMTENYTLIINFEEYLN